MNPIQQEAHTLSQDGYAVVPLVPKEKPAGWLLDNEADRLTDMEWANVEQSVRNLLEEFTRKHGKTETPTMPLRAAVVLASEYLRNEPPPADPIIPGLIDRGDKFNLVGPSKARKSFLALQLALCLASGKQFLNWDVIRPFRVLVIQFELKPDNYARRVRRMARALEITPEDIGERLVIGNMRGKPFSLDQLNVVGYDLVIIDPQYKLFAHENADENKQTDSARVFGTIDRIIGDQGPAMVVVHHAPKGRAGDRSIIDRGSGSGVQSRDFDGLATITPHRDHSDEWLVLDMILRNYPSPESRTIEFQDGQFIVRGDVLPEVQTSQSVNRARQAGPSVDDLSAKAAELITGPMRTVDVRDQIRKDFSVGEKKADTVIRDLERKGFRRYKSNTKPCYGMIEPPGRADSATKTGQPTLPGL